MASVSGVSSSNSSSIYGNRNVLSGLATGMDTEGMIQNAVSGYQTKINGLLKQQTSFTWQQEAFRKITDPMVKLSRKYTSYTSSTNLLSPSFFNKAVKTTSHGENSSKVGATGKTSSTVEILGVKQLASKSSYNVSASSLGLGGGIAGDAATIIAGENLDLAATMELSNVSGSLQLNYGGNRTIELNFDDLETYATPEDFVKAINSKLSDIKVANSDGDSVSASTMIKATLEGGVITFSDNKAAGNTVTITGATGKLKTTLGIDESAKASTIDMSTKDLVDENATTGDYLSGKTFTMTVDGKSKTIKMPEYTNDTDFLDGLNKAVQSEFGKTITVGLDAGKLKVVGQKGSTISINASEDIGKTLGLGGSTATSYMNTGSSLGTIPGLSLTQTKDGDGNITSETLGGIAGTALKSSEPITQNKTTGKYYDSEGNVTDKDGNRLGKDGKQLYGYDFEINGVKLTFTRDTAMENVLTAINSNTEMGLNANFSKTTNSLQLTSQETGSASQVVIDDKLAGSDTGNLAAKLFGVINDPTSVTTETAKGTYTAGQDAVLTMNIDGQEMEVSRTDNTFDVDGLNITLKGTFGYAGGILDKATEAVTFTTTADTDKIMTAVKDMVKDLNEVMKSVYEGFSTMPNYKSNKTRYEPLTEEDKAGMSESAIEKYEEKAKQGVIFGDSDLSSMYNKLVSAISPTGSAGVALAKMGITTSYESGVTSLSIDEDKLRSTLENNPDSVRDAFTSTTGTSGIMVNVSKVLEDYASTTGSTKGILIEKAGSAYAALSLQSNQIQTRIEDLDTEIDRWQKKLSNKVDYYTTQFTRLETLTNQMNSQSSMLMGMMGG